jgi:hypothetical protein
MDGEQLLCSRLLLRHLKPVTMLFRAYFWRQSCRDWRQGLVGLSPFLPNVSVFIVEVNSTSTNRWGLSSWN